MAWLLAFSLILALLVLGELVLNYRHRLAPRTPIAFNTTARPSFKGGMPICPKPAGVVRVAFLGASTTFCAEIPEPSKTWAGQTILQLQKQFGARHFDGVNAARPGYTMSSMLQVLKRDVLPFTPNALVVYQVTNNLSGDFRAQAKEQGLPGSSFAQHSSWLYDRSYLFRWLELNFSIYWFFIRQAFGKNFILDQSRVGKHYEVVLRELCATARAKGIQVFLPALYCRCNKKQPRWRQWWYLRSQLYFLPFMHPQAFLEGTEAMNEITAKVAQEEGAIFIPRPEQGTDAQAHFIDNLHYSEAGAVLFGAHLSQYIGDWHRATLSSQ